MINANFLLGEPVDFKGICKVYSPKIKDIIHDDKYGIYSKFLMQSQEDLEDEYTKLGIPIETVPTPFEHLFVMSEMDQEYEKYIKDGFKFFTGESITFLKKQKQIMMGELTEVVPTLMSVQDIR